REEAGWVLESRDPYVPLVLNPVEYSVAVLVHVHVEPGDGDVDALWRHSILVLKSWQDDGAAAEGHQLACWYCLGSDAESTAHRLDAGDLEAPHVVGVDHVDGYAGLRCQLVLALHDAAEGCALLGR